MPRQKAAKKTKTRTAAPMPRTQAKRARPTTAAAELEDDDGKLRIPKSMKTALQAKAKERGVRNWKTFALERLEAAALGRKAS